MHKVLIRKLTFETVLQNKNNSFYTPVMPNIAKIDQRNRYNNYHAPVMIKQLTTVEKHKKKKNRRNMTPTRFPQNQTKT